MKAEYFGRVVATGVAPAFCPPDAPYTGWKLTLRCVELPLVTELVGYPAPG
jgi:hypothetical protein